MKRTSAYFFNFLIVLFSGTRLVCSQDTIDFPLKYRLGMEVSGPAIWYSDKNILSTEAYFSIDLNEKRALMVGAGYLNYKYSQYNYEYRNNGFFVRSGIDFNLFKPDKSMGIYWAGIGMHYGLSRFSSEIPLFTQDNYWGTASSSVGKKSSWAHYIEANPGVRAEVFRNFSIGWTISLRMLLYSGTGKDLRSLYLPGFGSGGKTFSTGMNYFVVWNFPYKRIKAIIKMEEEEEEEEDSEVNINNTPRNGIRP